MFHIILKALIIFMFDGLQGFSYGWMLVCVLKVADEHNT
jgi:hypothetical protein